MNISLNEAERFTKLFAEAVKGKEVLIIGENDKAFTAYSVKLL